MPVGAVIGAVAGAGASIYGANKAAGAVGDAAAQNNALQKYIYDQNVGYETPWMNRGNAAGEMFNNAIGLGKDPAAAAAALDTYKNSTGFNFTLGQGVNALQSSAATRGMLRSGATLKATVGYGQQLGQNYFQNWLGNLTTQANQGQNAANALAGFGTHYADSVSQNNNNAANATGNAWLSSAGAVNGMIGNALGAYGMAGRMGSSYGSPVAYEQNSGGGMYSSGGH